MSTLGRPTVIDEEAVRKLEAAFRDGFSVTTACHVSGISRSTYYEHYDTNKDFSDKMDTARLRVTEQAKQVVVKSITEGDLASAKWWLERRARDEFGKEAKSDAQEQYERATEKSEKWLKDFLDDPDMLPENAFADSEADEMI